jgi:methylmalonyl-CoA mutase
MKSPDFTKIEYKSKNKPNVSYNDWKKNLEKETGKSIDDYVFDTMENISVKPLYTSDDIKNIEHLDYQAGIAPFLRGPYATMYVFRPWTVRQYAGFSTAEESNAFYLDVI